MGIVVIDRSEYYRAHYALNPHERNLGCKTYSETTVTAWCGFYGNAACIAGRNCTCPLNSTMINSFKTEWKHGAI